MKKLALAVVLLSLSVAAPADPLTVGSGDSVQKVLEGQVGKRVALRVRNGEELAGTVKSVNGEVVHLGELTGKEFYDAVVKIKAVDAVIVRVK